MARFNRWRRFLLTIIDRFQVEVGKLRLHSLGTPCCIMDRVTDLIGSVRQLDAHLSEDRSLQRCRKSNTIVLPLGPSW